MSKHDTSAVGVTKEALEHGLTSERLLVVMATLWSFLFSAETYVVRKNEAMSRFRTILNVFAAITSYIAITVGFRIWEHWCCYPKGTSIYGLTQGTCSNETSLINTSGNERPCNAGTITAGEWFLFVLAGTLNLLSIGTYIWSGKLFLQNTRDGFVADLSHVKEIIRRHEENSDEKDQFKNPPGYLIKYMNHVKDSDIAHTEYKKRRPPVIFARMQMMFFDPMSFIFHYPGYIIRQNAAVAVIRYLLHIAAIATILILYLVSIPAWEKTCCKTKALEAVNEDLGSCTNPASAINADPGKIKCGYTTWTPAMHIEYAVITATMITSAVIYGITILDFDVHAHRLVYDFIRRIDKELFEAKVDEANLKGHAVTHFIEMLGVYGDKGGTAHAAPHTGVAFPAV